jgi:hypothetical protein
MNRRAFTLVEVLIAVTIAMAVSGIAVAAFRQFTILQTRIMARIAMHQSAMHIVDVLNADITTMHQGAAFFAEAEAPGANDGSVRLAWMRPQVSDSEWSTYSGTDYIPWKSDLGWVLWTWDQQRQELLRGEFYSRAGFVLRQPWVENISGRNRNFLNHQFFTIPQPRRLRGSATANDTTIMPHATGSVMAHRLGDNAFGTPSPEDGGDWYQLRQTSVPIMRQVTDFAVQWLAADGSVVDCSTSHPGNRGADGVRLDGDGAAAIAARPRLLRLRFTLRDPVHDLSQQFSFSIPAPGFQPR